jgi:hypothetical protein
VQHIQETIEPLTDLAIRALQTNTNRVHHPAEGYAPIAPPLVGARRGSAVRSWRQLSTGRI